MKHIVNVELLFSALMAIESRNIFKHFMVLVKHSAIRVKLTLLMFSPPLI